MAIVNTNYYPVTDYWVDTRHLIEIHNPMIVVREQTENSHKVGEAIETHKTSNRDGFKLLNII